MTAGLGKYADLKADVLGISVDSPFSQGAWAKKENITIKLLSDLPVGSGTVDQARKAAGYLSKYISKAFDAPRVPGLHRFDVAQGFQPTRLRLHGRTSDEAIERAVEQMGGVVPAQIWRSDDAPQWQGPPAVWVSWQG